jgi:uncharacterized protein (DUF1015 family)
VYVSENYQGVKDVMGIIQDAKVIDLFLEKIQEKSIILADGHHRYESSLQYRRKKNAENPQHTGDEDYNFHLMYLTNMQANDICILPTHRLVSGLENFDKYLIINKLELYFKVQKVDDFYAVNELICGKKWTFGLVFKEEGYKITLKPEVWKKLNWQFPDIIKQLDLTVLHYFVLEKCLNIPGKIQTTTKQLNFSRNLTECVAKVMNDEAQIALITQGVTLEEIQKVCASGFTMPQKSTYFYPKAICGFLFGSIA